MKQNALKNKDPFSAQLISRLQYEKITLQKVQLCFQFLEMGAWAEQRTEGRNLS